MINIHICDIKKQILLFYHVAIRNKDKSEYFRITTNLQLPNIFFNTILLFQFCHDNIILIIHLSTILLLK